MKKSIIALILVVALFALAAVGCSAPATQAPTSAAPQGSAAATSQAPATSTAAGTGGTIKIGGLAPLTGEVSVYGIAANNGAKLAFEEAGTSVLNSAIEYICYDEKGDPTEAVNAYNKLVESDKVVAIVGDVTSTPTIAVAQKAVQDKIPMISPTGTAAAITEAGANIFRACFIDPFQGEIMASYASKKLSAKTAAILYNVSDDYSIGLTEAFEATAKELGIEVVSKEGYTKGDVDFKTQLTTISGKAPDVLFVPVYYQDLALIAVQAKDVGITATMLGADGWDGVLDKIDASNVSALDGTYFCNHYSAESNDPALQAFVAKYKQTYGEEANAFAALGYDAAGMLLQAIKTAGSTDADAIVAALTTIEYKGVTGNIKLDENRNPIKSAAINTIEGGVCKFVEYYDK